MARSRSRSPRRQLAADMAEDLLASDDVCLPVCRLAGPTAARALQVCSAKLRAEVQRCLPLVRCPGTVVVCGGVSGYGAAGVTRASERYDPGTNTWEALPPMQLARAYGGTASIAGKLYICGGDSADLRSCERFDPSSGRWEQLPGGHAGGQGTAGRARRW